MASKSMFKLLTAVMFFLNTHMAWGGEGQPAAPASPPGYATADTAENIKLRQCNSLKEKLRELKKELTDECIKAGYKNCEEQINLCDDAINTPKSDRQSRSSSLSRTSALLANQLGISPSLLNDTTSGLNTASTSDKRNSYKCPQLSGKNYFSEEKRIEEKITSIQDKIKTTQEKITDAMNKSTEKQEDFNKKSEDLQKDKDEAEENLSEEKKKARDEQLEKQREAAESLNKMKKQMTDLTKKIKGANTELSNADAAYRRKQSEILTKSEQKQSCVMQTNASLQKLKEAFATSNGSATKRTKELEAAMQSTYRMCMRKMENEIEKEKSEYQAKLQNLNDTIVSSQEEMKQLQEQIKNAENFDTQAQTNIETRNKELEAERDKKVNRANTALAAAQQNLLTQLQNLSTSVSQHEQTLKELQAKLIKAENDKSTLMAIAPSSQDILTTSENPTSARSTARKIGANIDQQNELIDEINAVCPDDQKIDDSKKPKKSTKQAR